MGLPVTYIHALMPFSLVRGQESTWLLLAR